MSVYESARTYVMQLGQKKNVVAIKSRKVDKTTLCHDNKGLFICEKCCLAKQKHPRLLTFFIAPLALRRHI